MSGASKPTVYKWLDRYERLGVDGLTDLPRSGRPPEVPDSVRSRIVALTRCTPPADTGLSHWSSREMAKHLKRAEGIAVSHNVIAQVWRDHDLQPQRLGTFKLSSDPEFETKVADVVGLYLDPPVGAVVLSIDEKTPVQALDRTQPVLPIDFAKTEKRTHDYVRHGTTNLFAALDTLTGEVLGSATSGGALRSFSSSWTQLSHGTSTARSMSSWTTCRRTRGMTWTPGSPSTPMSPFTSPRPAVPG